MKATHRTVINGQVFNVGDDLPEYGSIVVLENNNGGVIYAEGLSEDVSKLSTALDWVAEGSKALMTDTNDVYSFTDGEWIEMGASE